MFKDTSTTILGLDLNIAQRTKSLRHRAKTMFSHLLSWNWSSTFNSIPVLKFNPSTHFLGSVRRNLPLPLLCDDTLVHQLRRDLLRPLPQPLADFPFHVGSYQHWAAAVQDELAPSGVFREFIVEAKECKKLSVNGVPGTDVARWDEVETGAELKGGADVEPVIKQWLCVVCLCLVCAY